jgi:hypothetical protein
MRAIEKAFHRWVKRACSRAFPWNLERLAFRAGRRAGRRSKP